jgi:Mg2+-importing ATPase
MLPIPTALRRILGLAPITPNDRVEKPGVPPELLPISRLDVAGVLEYLGTSAQGLSPDEALRRLDSYGPNTVRREARKSLVRQIAERLANPLNVLLLTLAAVSYAMGSQEAAAIIFVMVVLSVSLAFLQERRSSLAAEKLRAMVHTTATVVRSGPPEDAEERSGHAGTREIPIVDLVPGDIVHLSAGDMIPADLRLIASKDLFVDQATLTGEALPVEKSADTRAGPEAEPFQWPNVCYMGTSVQSGSATGAIVLTGPRAYFGTIAGLISGERALTSFDRGIARFAGLMIRFILAMTPIVFLINGLTKGNWIEAMFFAMAVAVGLTPEMLPMIVTVNLGKGAIDMSRKKVIVKRLNAIQNFGAMDVLCTDKTGTLTQNRIILEKHVDLFGETCERVLEYAYLNSYYQSGLKNLLDDAVLKYTGLHERVDPARSLRLVDEIPFDFLRRRMSVVVEKDERHLLITKGAVEEVFDACRTGESGGESFPLDSAHRSQFRAMSDALNADGFRVIAIACKDLPGDRTVYGVKDESELVLLGFIAFLDPPKETAAKAIRLLESHGVAVKILTGDNDVVTRRICREVDLKVTRVLLGSDVDALSDEDLSQAVQEAQVFAKLSPTQKARIVESLHRKGHVVGFLGDGINDGPALKTADVGISVDTAVDIAKESADIILLEKSLLVLGEGVLAGRKVFGNIIKYIRMGASSNFGNMFSVIGASAWLPFLPMAPIQVLTNNLLYDFSQVAIPTDNVDPEYLASPRQWEIRNIARFMLFIGPISSIFDYATYATMFFYFGANTPGRAHLFQTGWFVESLLSQTLIIHIIRTDRIPFVESRPSMALFLTSLAICAVGVFLPVTPVGRALGFVPLPHAYWPIVALFLVAYLTLTHFMKVWFHRRFGLN